MKLSDDTYERIERYLLQEMTAEEAAAFEATCQADPDLAAALAHEKKIHLLIRIHNQNQIRQQVRSLDNAARQPRIIPFRRMTLTVGSIAAILLVAIGYWWIGGSAELTGGQMAQEAEKAFAAILYDPTIRGQAPNAEDSLASLVQQGAWAEASAYYLGMPDSLQFRPWPRLACAQAYYEQDQYAPADSLSQLAMGAAATASSGVPCKAKLLRVLILLRLDQLAEAKTLIGYTPDDEWKAQWNCLRAQQYDALEKLDEELPKKLP